MCTPLLHQQGYRNIGYEIDPEGALQVSMPDLSATSVWEESTRQLTHNFFSANNPDIHIAGLDLPDLKGISRVCMGMFLPRLLEQIALYRDHYIFQQAEINAKTSEHNWVNIFGCNHFGVMHQLIAYAYARQDFEILDRYRFIFLTEAASEPSTVLWGTNLPAYPLDALFIDVNAGSKRVKQQFTEYLRQPTRIPSTALMKQISEEVLQETSRQKELYERSYKTLFRVFDIAERQKRISSIGIVSLGGGMFEHTIESLARLTFEAAEHGGVLQCQRSGVQDIVIDTLEEAGFTFDPGNPAEAKALPTPGPRFFDATNLHMKAIQFYETKDYESATKLFAQLASYWRQFGVEKELQLRNTLYYLGISELEAGNLVEARENLLGALKLAVDIGRRTSEPVDAKYQENFERCETLVNARSKCRLRCVVS
jgi:hypothetical protein